jgi:hypothetical protein
MIAALKKCSGKNEKREPPFQDIRQLVHPVYFSETCSESQLLGPYSDIEEKIDMEDTEFP